MTDNQPAPDLTETKKLGSDLKIVGILGGILAFFFLVGVIWTIIKKWAKNPKKESSEPLITTDSATK